MYPSVQASLICSLPAGMAHVGVLPPCLTLSSHFVASATGTCLRMVRGGMMIYDFRFV